MLPNIISLLRFLLSPLILLVPRERLFPFFLVLAFSDFLDGFLARRLKAESSLGRILDPLADKAMNFFALYTTVFKFNLIPSYIFWSLVLRDILIVLGGLHMTISKGVVPKARPLGKLTTFMVSFLVVISLLGFNHPIFYYLCQFFILASFLDYVYVYLRSFR
ncbi:CDP-alcohol phosphatidyltransferase family protein [Thermocrinis minervae]|uniref:CDP-alcohol phosphatidyltransferase family protein n=1 Tax=Thermocrinis minervae TaxID=381751 RepID=UPI00155FCBE8|nr:CDP-alcohol phosphatidyltransferase family protein [Thermocrinis minervae]